MIGPWRQLAVAAAINVTLCVGVGTAQTVMVRNAPPGSVLEVVLNQATVGSVVVSAGGDATAPVDLAAHGGKEQTDAYLHVDVCGSTYRVLLAERGQLPPAPGDNCTKRESLGLFLVRRVTSFVVDVSGGTPTARLRQGPVPAEWLLKPEEEAIRASAPGRLAPMGFVVFGGGGYTGEDNAVATFCGNVSECGGDDFRPGYTAGATVWLRRYLGVDASYVRPSDVVAEGAGVNYNFKSSFDLSVATVGAKVALPLKIVRIYGLGGMNYHRGVFATTQTTADTIYTTADRTQTIDGVEVTIPGVTVTLKGGTQNLEWRTAGWGWMFGAGVEVWVARSFAIYADATRLQIKGDSRDGAEGTVDTRVNALMIGARVRIGK